MQVYYQVNVFRNYEIDGDKINVNMLLVTVNTFLQTNYLNVYHMHKVNNFYDVDKDDNEIVKCSHW